MSDRRDEPGESLEGLGWILAAAVIGTCLAWCGAVAVCLAYSGRTPRLGLVTALLASLRVLSGNHLHDPAAAYPVKVAALMPGAVGWWVSAGGFAVAAGSVVAAVLLRVEPQVARERLGRRPYDWRGARPRAWGRGRDLARPSRESRGFALGRLDGKAIFADEESHVAVIAPTRAGKTTRCVAPWLVEHDGPAVVTSTKRDVLELTQEQRARGGRIWIFDPFSADSTTWSPVAGCRSWSYCLRQAQWLADASAGGDSEVARYWRGEAAKLLAPLLHAAALERSDIDTVLAWVDAQDTRRPTVLLRSADADAAALQLQAVADLDGRNRGTTYMSAGSILAGYRYPEVAACIGQDFSAEKFLGSARDTLYLVSAERHQQLLAPLLVSMISAVIYGAIESGEFRQGDRRLRILLDEAANIAPLPDLPRMLSQAAGHGIRIATLWQSLAQMSERHGHSADTILANSATKLFTGSITDSTTRDYIYSLLGSDPDDAGRRRPRTTAGALQQAEFGRALVVAGSRPPALVSLPDSTSR